MRDPDGIGSWPRRLLHVPTMTSMTWQPGNTYGDYPSPRYNALSYTWGRFRLDKEGRQRPEDSGYVRGLRIDGVEWTVPPIQPEHFTDIEFRNVLDRVSQSVQCDPVEFVWVDIACIDQRMGSEEGGLEVGRQAAIFHGAQQVFIWLTKSLAEDVQKTWASIILGISDLDLDFVDSRTFVTQETGAQIARLETLKGALGSILADPWFSSLWTLQEAALASEAELLSRDAKQVARGVHNKFEQFRDIVNTVQIQCSRGLLAARDGRICRDRPAIAALCQDISSLIQSRGIPELYWGNRLALYAAAGNRTATEACDYVYAIQQIFRYRLGKTAEGAAGSQTWTLAELETELGRRLITDYPVQSQMHVFTKPVAPGKGWHIGLSSLLPTPLAGTGHTWTGVWEEPLEAQCKLTVQTKGTANMGHFQGLMCDYSVLHRWWMKINRPTQGRTSYQRVALDAVSRDLADQTGEPLYYRTAGHMRQAWPGAEQDELSAWLAGAFATTSQLSVLRLGSREDRESREVVGMILRKRKGASRGDLPACNWRRLGFCYWSNGGMPLADGFEHTPLAAEDQSEGWKPTTGLFG